MMRRCVVWLAALVSVGLAVAGGLVAIAQGVMAAAAVPRTIPAPQRWTPGQGGGYTFRPGTRVVALDQRLAGTARLLAEDLAAVTATSVDWVLGGAVRPGDLTLRLGSVEGGIEAYRLTVASTVDIEGDTDAGVFYGTRTILQLLHQNRTIPGGTVADWPVYPERGLMLDTGRQFFSISFLHDQIRELAYLKLNYLHLHLSDVNGFRLQSATHPEVTSALHYTTAEIRELVDYAARYHVQVVPELDFPGHMNAILAAHPELKLVSKAGVVNDGFVDLSKPAAYTLMHDLLTEFLPQFPGT